MMRPTLLILLGACALALAGGGAWADQDLAVPLAAQAPTLDGRLDEPAWDQALRLPVEAVEVPAPPPAGGTLRVTPVVRLLVAGGRLWVSVEVAEDPGAAMGLHLLVAPEDAGSAAEAVSLGFRPVEVRAPRYAVRGPRGATRAAYRLEGAADWTAVGRWSAEACVPLVDLVGQEAAAALRVALVVFTRTPNLVATSPPGVRWTAPARWPRLVSPGGGWPLASAEIDAERLQREDRSDRARRLAWLRFQAASSVDLPPELSETELIPRLQGLLFDPLGEMERHRPDLRVPVMVLLGDAHQRLGQAERAAWAFREALKIAPGWREAQYGLHLQVNARRLAESSGDGAAGQASDYAAALARLDRLEQEQADDPWALEGVALARGLLLYKRGEFEGASALLEPLGRRYPHDVFIDTHARFALRAAKLWPDEVRRRARDAERRLPRAVLKTKAGRIVIELFEDDAPNTVNNFVWLGQSGFYDGTRFHRILPFFVVQGGDCTTRPGAETAAAPGGGTPGYAIRTEASGRQPFRGAVGMANVERDTEGSQFYVLTGTAMHLRGEQTIFGRVVEGLDVAGRLLPSNRIESIAFEDLDPERTYRPTTVAGSAAPEPDCR